MSERKNNVKNKLKHISQNMQLHCEPRTGLVDYHTAIEHKPETMSLYAPILLSQSSCSEIDKSTM